MSRAELAGRWLPVAAVGSLIGFVKAESLADPNVLWGIRDGRQITGSGDLPHHDHWSWTVAGKRWVPNSWGWDVVLGALHRLGGGGALAALNIVLVVVLALAVATAAFRLGARTPGVVAAVAVVGAPILLPWVNDRPQLISYVFALIVVAGVVPALTATRHSYYVYLAAALVVQTIWVNLHFFAIIGPVLIAVAGVGHLVERRRNEALDVVSLREQAVRLVALTVAAVLGCGLTPYGPVVAAKTAAVHNDAVGLIEEWRPAGFASYSQLTAVLAIAAALIAAVHAYRARRWHIAAIVVVLGIGAAIACRMAPVTAVVALPEISLAVSAAMHRPSWRRLGGSITVAFLVVGVGLAAIGADSLGRLNLSSVSPKLLVQLPSGCRLVNDYRLGGAVILFRPDVPVSVDSRTDLYGRNRILANRHLLDGRDGAVKSLDRDRVTCVLIPSDAHLVNLLQRDPTWRTVASDDTRTLLVKR